jgi:hypothetical protein
MAESKRKSQPKSKAKPEPRQFNTQMVAIALIFVLLIVSYVVIFASPTQEDKSKNMTFAQDNENEDRRIGNVEDIEYDLSELYLTIRDASSGQKEIINDVVHGSKAETPGGFNVTFLDENGDDRLTSSDTFIVYNAHGGDELKIYLSESNELVAFYTF